MKLAIMQPYFFPYIGYFSLMDYADEFILFDIAQYDRKGWMNRNRVLKPEGDWQYIRAGIVKPPFRACIKDVQVEQGDEWKKGVLRQLEHYKVKAPYYQDVVEMVDRLLACSAETLVELNQVTLEGVRDLLAIHCPIRICSSLSLDLGEIAHAGQWALRISEAYGADEYINPVGGKSIFKPEEFEAANIRLSFLQKELRSYPQGGSVFEPGLSIIDVLMFNSVEAVREQLKMYEVQPARG